MTEEFSPRHFACEHLVFLKLWPWNEWIRGTASLAEPSCLLNISFGAFWSSQTLSHLPPFLFLSPKKNKKPNLDCYFPPPLVLNCDWFASSLSLLIRAVWTLLPRWRGANWIFCLLTQSESREYASLRALGLEPPLPLPSPLLPSLWQWASPTIPRWHT